MDIVFLLEEKADRRGGSPKTVSVHLTMEGAIAATRPDLRDHWEEYYTVTPYELLP